MRTAFCYIILYTVAILKSIVVPVILSNLVQTPGWGLGKPYMHWAGPARMGGGGGYKNTIIPNICALEPIHLNLTESR